MSDAIICLFKDTCPFQWPTPSIRAFCWCMMSSQSVRCCSWRWMMKSFVRRTFSLQRTADWISVFSSSSSWTLQSSVRMSLCSLLLMRLGSNSSILDDFSFMFNNFSSSSRWKTEWKAIGKQILANKNTNIWKCLKSLGHKTACINIKNDYTAVTALHVRCPFAFMTN